MESAKFPYEIKPADKALHEEYLRYYKGEFTGQVFVGPKRYCMPSGYQDTAAEIYHLPLRTGDSVVCTYPRSGTTWTQELVWLVVNDLDFATAKSVQLTNRYLFVEESSFWTTEQKKILQQTNVDEKVKEAMKAFLRSVTETLANTPSPRFIKTHLPFSLLPPTMLDVAKVVYVARDPRDVVVSFYHFTKGNKILDFQGDFELFFDWFIRDVHLWSPFFEHVKEAWQMRHHPNLLFLFYEDLCKDLPGVCRRVAQFYGKQYTDEQISALAQHLHFDNFKNNKAVDVQNMREIGIFKEDMKFVRKGKSGGWRETFDPEMTRRADAWMTEQLRGTDLVFPH